MRKLIAGMKISLDGKTADANGYADWVSAWSDDYDVMPQVDACVLGAGMYPGYEAYWTTIRNEPAKPLAMTGKTPTPAEIVWAHFAAETPHYVLSSALSAAAWPNTRFLRNVADVAALKRQEGKDIYLVGGGRTTAGLIDAGLVDELRLLIYPVIAGDGRPLFSTPGVARGVALRDVRRLPDGRAALTCALA